MISSSQSSEASIASSSPRYEVPVTSDHVPTSQNVAAASTNFTFVLNDSSHSSQLLSESRPQHDRFAHTRGKRKRTSAADFSVLEREYEREPRPDKTLRSQIAEQVSLNEKEVQIWFQNRRQMTRRKARTWQPNEISEIIKSSQHTSGSASPPPSQELSSQSQQSSVFSTSGKGDCEPNEKPAQGLFMNASLSTFQHQEGMKAHGANDGTMQEEQGSEHVPSDPTEANSENELQDSLLREGEEKDGSDVQEQVPGAGGVSAPLVRGKALKRSSSSFRLRMSLEGKAELILDKNSPSPPSKTNRRESWPARGPLRRSQSAFTTSSPSLEQTSVDVSTTPGQSPAQYREILRPAGRSRDARAWQFYCDSDTKDALSIAAESDRRGSAQAALSLMRSNSAISGSTPGSPLLPNTQKQNRSAGLGAQSKLAIEAEKTNKAEKRKSLEDLSGTRPKLPRTTSSVARLQSSSSGAEAAAKIGNPLSSQQLGGKRSKGGSITIFRDGDSDSDKENWQPGTRVSAPSNPRRAHAGVASRSALGLNTVELSHEGSLGALMHNKTGGNARRRKPAGATRSKPSATDDEVATFMGERSTKQGNAGDGDDMDAVQNLLRLSQGGRW